MSPAEIHLRQEPITIQREQLIFLGSELFKLPFHGDDEAFLFGDRFVCRGVMSLDFSRRHQKMPKLLAVHRFKIRHRDPIATALANVFWRI